MKKILFIGQFPPPVHGVSVMNEYIIKSKLLKESFNIRIIDLKFGKSIKDLQRFSLLKVYKAFIYGLQIMKEMLIYKPNLVYFTISPTGFAFYRDSYYIFLIKLFKIKLLIHLHGKGIQNSIMNNFWKKMLYKNVFKKTQIICLSKILSDDIKDVYKGNPFIVPNGIKSHLKSGIKVKQSIYQIPQILFLSNLAQNKGILILIEALAILNVQGYSFKARLVGAPSNLTVEKIELILHEQNLTSLVEVVGPLFGDAKFKEYEKADIFVFPTYNDVFGLVNLEAMQFGLPVISTFEGGIPEIVINNETGLLVEKQNPQMLADKIAILLKDKEKRDIMGEKGYDRYIKNYTLEQFESNMNKTFLKVL